MNGQQITLKNRRFTSISPHLVRMEFSPDGVFEDRLDPWPGARSKRVDDTSPEDIYHPAEPIIVRASPVGRAREGDEGECTH